MEILGVAITAAIASIAWLYQKAWERQERRTVRYVEFIDRLSAFTAGNLNAIEMNSAIREVHRLWLFAPDAVVDACERILDIAEGKGKNDPTQRAVGECVIAMRKDSSFSAALLPRFWTTKLSADQFRLRSARLPKP